MKHAFRFALLLSLGGISPNVQAGDSVGNGGDYLRVVFEEGRQLGIEMIKKMRSCAIPESVPSNVRNWILLNQSELVKDMTVSPFVWIADSNDTCANTPTTRQAEISLSYEACRPLILDRERAARLLLHEVTHHFGIADENFADWVSYAIAEAQNDEGCSIPPGDDVFNANICPDAPMTAEEAIAKIGPPHSFGKRLGDFAIHTRTRMCYAIGGCTDWTMGGDLKFAGFSGETTYDRSGNRVAASFPATQRAGDVRLGIANNKPFFALKSADDNLQAWWSTQGSETYYFHYNYYLGFDHEINGTEVKDGELSANCRTFLFTGPYSRMDDYMACSDSGTPKDLSTAVRPTGTLISGYDGRLTNSCLWLNQSAIASGQDGQGNSFNRETEVVIYSKF